MKVQDVINQLEQLDKEADIYVALRNGYRPFGTMKEIEEITPVFDQDTNKKVYVLDVDLQKEIQQK
ncbi:hypothetical protein CVD28_01610 [Bacillus sp. M6-12]|uniref:hypothetical protein n=1 Tax=Bacillus sp. M6-12 TaxID=2054166 RepID=UPI000C767E74|nr:hypothetical protein [Bacillus sp. M6-12]PLS19130.1 hypothetical protein CVD28_01610 [Bacillus sp. M6-12]